MHTMTPDVATRHAIAVQRFQQLQQRGYAAELDALTLDAQVGMTADQEEARKAQIADARNTSSNAYEAARVVLAEIHALQQQLPPVRRGRWARLREALRS